jgi:hypothetical protein
MDKTAAYNIKPGVAAALPKTGSGENDVSNKTKELPTKMDKAAEYNIKLGMLIRNHS